MTFKLQELLSARLHNYRSHTSWSPLFCRSKHLWDCVILVVIYVGEVKNTLKATYLFTAYCAVLLLGIIGHPLPAEAPQVGRYAFIGPGGSPPEAGSWEVAAGEQSSIYEVWSGERWWRDVMSASTQEGRLLSDKNMVTDYD